MIAHPETKKCLIVVRTYLSPATSGNEGSCTAAITEDGKWLRLFPIAYRFLSKDQKFRKYDWIQCLVTKAKTDNRPESYRLQDNSIKVLPCHISTANHWEARKQLIFPLRKHCLCCIAKERNEKGYPTLGLFRPKTIKRLIIESDTPNWSEDQLRKLRQTDFFKTNPKTELEKIPFNFKYEFSCDESLCNGHTITCVDWEMGQSWRRWKRQYGEGWKDKFRQKYEAEMIEKNETHFYVGTVHRYPATWIIVGLFYPPKTLQELLF